MREESRVGEEGERREERRKFPPRLFSPPAGPLAVIDSLRPLYTLHSILTIHCDLRCQTNALLHIRSNLFAELGVS